MRRGGPVRCWGDDFQLQDLLASSPGGRELATRDFALLTLAAALAAEFPDQLVFKGGFVLRHGFGVLRFSKDIDATKDKPPKNKLDPDRVAEAIRQAGIGDQVRFEPGSPAIDTARGLDFDAIKVAGTLIEEASVQVEVSYREEVVDPPLVKRIGPPFYKPFPVSVMQPHEIAAEKLRTLAQRTRPTDLADLAVVLGREEVADRDIARIAPIKFQLVAQGRANRVERIEKNLSAIGQDYDFTVPAIFPDAPSYKEAMSIVWPRIKSLIPL